MSFDFDIGTAGRWKDGDEVQVAHGEAMDWAMSCLGDDTEPVSTWFSIHHPLHEECRYAPPQQRARGRLVAGRHQSTHSGQKVERRGKRSRRSPGKENRSMSRVGHKPGKQARQTADEDKALADALAEVRHKTE